MSKILLIFQHTEKYADEFLRRTLYVSFDEEFDLEASSMWSCNKCCHRKSYIHWNITQMTRRSFFEDHCLVSLTYSLF